MALKALLNVAGVNLTDIDVTEYEMKELFIKESCKIPAFLMEQSVL